MELRNYWPEFLRELVEFGAVATAEQPEFDVAAEAIDTMAMEFSAFTLTVAGIKRWEQILGITGMEADDLDSRRFRIQSRLLEQIPITKRTLHQQLEILCGQGGFTMSLGYGDYSLGISVALTARSAFADVDAMVHKLAPANLVITVSLLYNKYKEFKGMTHGQMSAYTHRQLREEANL